MEETLEPIPQRSPLLVGRRVAKLYPLWDEGPPLLMWAERGRIHWEDTRRHDYGSLDWPEAARRVLALSEMVRRARQSGGYVQELRRVQQFICDMEEVIRQAKEQRAALGS